HRADRAAQPGGGRRGCSWRMPSRDSKRTYGVTRESSRLILMHIEGTLRQDLTFKAQGDEVASREREETALDSLNNVDRKVGVWNRIPAPVAVDQLLSRAVQHHELHQAVAFAAHEKDVEEKRIDGRWPLDV